jgi:O-antigen/teichoic acid export membrane protein
MTDTLSTTEIKKRSIKGAKWLIVMNGFGMPAAFLIALMLGRVGPEALGIYALAQILIGVITTFVVYGGPPVLSVFMPKITNAEDRGRFVFSYLMILIMAMAAVLSLFWLFPKAFEFLLQRKFDMRNYGWFVLLSLVIVATETFANAASGLMLIKVTAIARQMMRTVLLPLVAFLFFFKREILIDYGMSCILGGFLVGYLAAAVISIVGIIREPRFKMRPGWLLPPGFWAFSIATMGTTVFSFLYTNFDRMAVLSIQDIVGLGVYQAVLSVVALLERIPTLLLSSIIPTFSHLQAKEDQTTFQRSFDFLCRWSVFQVSFPAMVIIAFSPQVLGAFGATYVKYDYLLGLFCFVCIIRSMGLPSLVILTCKEKNAFRFNSLLIWTLLQIMMTLLLISRFGVLAIAGSKMLFSSLSSLTATFYVFYVLRLSPRLPLAYFVAIVVGVILTFLRVWVLPPEWWASVMLASLSVAAFLIIGGFRRKDILLIVRYMQTKGNRR